MGNKKTKPLTPFMEILTPIHFVLYYTFAVVCSHLQWWVLCGFFILWTIDLGVVIIQRITN